MTLASRLVSYHILFQLLQLLSFWESSPWLPPSCTRQLETACFSPLLFLFPEQSQFSACAVILRAAAFSTDVCLFYLAVNTFSALHMETEDMAIISFRCSDIIGEKSQQGICRQDLNDLFYISSISVLYLYLSSPSSSSFILAFPSFPVQATTFFLASLNVSFPPLQLGGLLCPSFSFWGFRLCPWFHSLFFLHHLLYRI